MLRLKNKTNIRIKRIGEKYFKNSKKFPSFLKLLFILTPLNPIKEPTKIKTRGMNICAKRALLIVTFKNFAARIIPGYVGKAPSSTCLNQ